MPYIRTAASRRRSSAAPVAAAPTIRGVAAQGNQDLYSATSYSLARPPGTTTGDIIYAFALGEEFPITTPAGFTVLNTHSDPAAPYSAIVLARRVVQAGDTGNIVFGMNGAGDCFVSIVVVSGANTTNPENATAYGPTANGSSMTLPGVTTTVPNCLLLQFVAMRAAQTGELASTPTGMTELFDLNDSWVSGAAFSQVISAAGPTGNRTSTKSGASYYRPLTVAVAPA